MILCLSKPFILSLTLTISTMAPNNFPSRFVSSLMSRKKEPCLRNKRQHHSRQSVHHELLSQRCQSLSIHIEVAILLYDFKRFSISDVVFIVIIFMSFISLFHTLRNSTDSSMPLKMTSRLPCFILLRRLITDPLLNTNFF